MGVLVVDDVGLVARVAGEERVLVRERVPGWWNRYICMRGGMPSGGVFMLALSMWLPSGSPPSRLAPSMRVALHRVAVHGLEVARAAG